MGNVSTTVIQPGDDLDPSIPDANWAAILAEMNGNLQALVNVKVASAGSITGKQNAAGGSDALAAADHAHIVQGVENLPSDPTSGNFNGRLWWDTTTSQWKGITDTSGPTVKVLGNLAASDLVHHAANHVDGGIDQLADTSIAERSMKAKTVYSASQASDVGPLTASAWTTIVDLSVTTTGAQTLWVMIRGRADNSSGSNKPTTWLRLVDVTASNLTVYRSDGQRLDVNGSIDRVDLQYSFPYTTPSGGARTLRLQATTGTSSSITITKPTTVSSDAVVPPNIMAVIL